MSSRLEQDDIFVLPVHLLQIVQQTLHVTAGAGPQLAGIDDDSFHAPIITCQTDGILFGVNEI